MLQTLGKVFVKLYVSPGFVSACTGPAWLQLHGQTIFPVTKDLSSDDYGRAVDDETTMSRGFKSSRIYAVYVLWAPKSGSAPFPALPGERVLETYFTIVWPKHNVIPMWFFQIFAGDESEFELPHKMQNIFTSEKRLVIRGPTKLHELLKKSFV